MHTFFTSRQWLLATVLAILHTSLALDLAPISHPDHIHNAAALARRDTSFTGELDLQDFETFYWGAPAGTNLIYANLTVYFPEQYERVIAMERFTDQLKSVRCAEDMMLEFKDDASFEYAKDVWNWVNDDVNRTFIMVTNYAGCADDMERLPFVVSNIRYDEKANKAFLKADLKEWEEVAHSYTLNVGHTPLTSAHRMLMSRGLLARDSDFSMSLVSGFDQNLFSATVGDWTTSVDAVVRTVGSLDVDFDVDVSWLKLKSAAMTISPENVAASIQLALSEKGKLGKAYTWQDTIVSIPVNGIEIAKVVKLGAFLDIDVGFTMSEWEGTASASLGARMELSNSAIVKIDLVDSANNKFSGWTPKFSAIPLTLNAKVEGSARVFAEPNVKIEASALGKGWNVGLNLQMPYIEADFAAMLETSGVCNSKKTVGVDVDARVGVELSVQAATKGNEGNPFWEQELFSSEWDLFSKCMPFGPDNAKPGEPVQPKPPKSKKPKSKAPKASKTPKPKPKSSKPAVTLKPTLGPKKPVSKVSRPSPSKAESTRTAKPTDLDKPSSKSSTRSSSDNSKLPGPTSKPSSPDKEPSKTPARSTPATSEKSSKSDISPSAATSLSSQAKSSSHSSKTNDQQTPSGSQISDVSSRLSSTSLVSASSRNISISNPSITRPPSTLSSAASTSASASSSSRPSSCPLNQKDCIDCGELEDPDNRDREYFASLLDATDPDPISPNITSRHLFHLLPRKARDPYKFKCTSNGNTNTHDVALVPYPAYRDLSNPTVTVSQFYKAKESGNCLDHDITALTASSTPYPTGNYAMEHIYEGNWIVRFLEHLSTTEKIPCDVMGAIFFAEWNKPGVTTKQAPWIKTLMASLGSYQNQNQLVFLWQDINGEKHRIFDLGNDIIADKTFKSINAARKIKRMATVGRAMAYMQHPDVGAKLLLTAQHVERTLTDIVSNLPHLLNPQQIDIMGRLREPGVLAARHRKWLNGFLAERSEVVITSMSRWASVASGEFVKISPTQVVGTMDPKDKSLWSETTKFLKTLQQTPAPERREWVEKYAPLLI